MMTRKFKIDNSHCTTPSERVDPEITTVKVGCLRINPASTTGRRLFLLQMVVLCFVPHVALILQNCSIMAHLSQTFESSLFLNNEVHWLLSLGETIISIQDERLLVSKYILDEATLEVVNKDELQRVFFVVDTQLTKTSLVPDSMKREL